MTRSLALLSSAALLTAAVNAQCPQSNDAGLVKWSSSSSYGSTWDVDDEGISPAIALPFAFPMPGVTANLDQVWVNSNGELYLSDSTAGQTEPAGGALFGVNSTGEVQGPAGSNPRIFPIGQDQEGSDTAAWSVTYDTSVAGQATFTWYNWSAFGGTTNPPYHFQATLFSTGTVQFDYGTIPGASRYVGVSIGNAEPISAGSQDLTTLPTSGLTDGTIYESFTSATWDLSGQSVIIVPDFTVGNENYMVAAVVPYAAPACASHEILGVGCHDFVGPDLTSNFFELFPDSPSAKAALDGNALLFTLNGSGGYDATWIPGGAGALYMAPSGTATATSLGDDSTTSLTPSLATPIPGGTTANWTISSNGVLTAGTTGNQGTSFSPSLSSTATQTGLAFYTWRDWNPNETGSQPIRYEEIGSTLFISWDGVEAYGTPSPNPGVWQFQIDLGTGNVTIVWVSFEASTSTSDVLVGCTLAGAGPTPTSVTLSTSTPYSLIPPVTLNAMTLSAAPRPVINPSTNVVYAAGDMPEFAPGSGLTVGTMFLSVNPNPGGFDLSLIGLTTVPGCNAYIGTLDLDLGAVVGVVGVPSTWNFAFSTPVFTPGNVIAAQAVGLFIGGPLPNGEAGGFLFSNGVQSTTEVN